MSNVSIPFKRLNISNLMTFEWCFLISNIMRISMQCHHSLYYVIYLGTLVFAVQRNVFINLLWFLLILLKCVPHAPMYQRALHAYVLLCQRVLRAYVFFIYLFTLYLMLTYKLKIHTFISKLKF